MKKTFFITTVLLLIFLLSCNDDPKTSSKDEYENLIAIDITNNGGVTVIKEKEEIRFFAQGTFKDGTTKVLDVTKLKWKSSDTATAYISDDGLFKAIRQGVTVITASYKDIESNEITMRVVSQNGLQSITANILGASSRFFVGETYQFRAQGNYGTGDKQDMTESVTWKTTDENIATISNSFGSHGRLTVKSPGRVEVYCILNGLESNHIPIITEEVNLENIVLNIEKNEVYVEERVKFSVIAQMSNNDEKNITDEIEWHYETTLVPEITEDNYIYATTEGVYRFHVSYQNKISNTVELTVNKREGILNSIELKVIPDDNIYQNETVITLQVTAKYSDHEEDITTTADIFLAPLPPNEDYNIDECYNIDANGLIFTKPGNFQFYAEYTPQNGEKKTSNVVNITVNELNNGVKPQLGDLIINEMLVAPPTDSTLGDANNDGIRSGTDDEFIEIINVTDKILDLTNVYLSDMADNIVANFPDGTLVRPHQVLVIFGGGNPTGDFGGATVFTLPEGRSLSLNNGGDIIFINIDEDGDGNFNNDPTIFSAIYDEWNWHMGSAVLYPELTTSTPGEGSYVGHCNPENLDPAPECTKYYSPGTRIDGSAFY